jgi:uncharacterized protein (TIGR02147 family)
MKNEVQPLQNYRSFLRGMLIEKQKKNPQFSLRGFAKAMGIQSSYLSMILSGKRDLSEAMVAQISERLNLEPLPAKKFSLLVRLEKAATALQREQIIQDLEALEPQTKGRRDLAIDQFRAIAEWYHLPLQILIDLDGFKWSEEAAAKALGITVHQVHEALERLAALELIDLTNPQKPKRAEGRVIVESPFKSEAMKKYNTQMLEKTITALTEQTNQERYTATLNLALDPQQVKAARAVLDEAYEKISAIAEKRAKKKILYHTNFNLFKLIPENK